MFLLANIAFFLASAGMILQWLLWWVKDFEDDQPQLMAKKKEKRR